MKPLDCDLLELFGDDEWKPKVLILSGAGGGAGAGGNAGGSASGDNSGSSSDGSASSTGGPDASAAAAAADAGSSFGGPDAAPGGPDAAPGGPDASAAAAAAAADGSFGGPDASPGGPDASPGGPDASAAAAAAAADGSFGGPDASPGGPDAGFGAGFAGPDAAPGGPEAQSSQGFDETGFEAAAAAPGTQGFGVEAQGTPGVGLAADLGLNDIAGPPGPPGPDTGTQAVGFSSTPGLPGVQGTPQAGVVGTPSSQPGYASTPAAQGQIGQTGVSYGTFGQAIGFGTPGSQTQGVAAMGMTGQQSLSAQQELGTPAPGQPDLGMTQNTQANLSSVLGNPSPSSPEPDPGGPVGITWDPQITDVGGTPSNVAAGDVAPQDSGASTGAPTEVQVTDQPVTDQPTTDQQVAAAPQDAGAVFAQAEQAVQAPTEAAPQSSDTFSMLTAGTPFADQPSTAGDVGGAQYASLSTPATDAGFGPAVPTSDTTVGSQFMNGPSPDNSATLGPGSMFANASEGGAPGDISAAKAESDSAKPAAPEEPAAAAPEAKSGEPVAQIDLPQVTVTPEQTPNLSPAGSTTSSMVGNQADMENPSGPLGGSAKDDQPSGSSKGESPPTDQASPQLTDEAGGAIKAAPSSDTGSQQPTVTETPPTAAPSEVGAPAATPPAETVPTQPAQPGTEPGSQPIQQGTQPTPQMEPTAGVPFLPEQQQINTMMSPTADQQQQLPPFSMASMTPQELQTASMQGFGPALEGQNQGGMLGQTVSPEATAAAALDTTMDPNALGFGGGFSDNQQPQEPFADPLSGYLMPDDTRRDQTGPNILDTILSYLNPIQSAEARGATAHATSPITNDVSALLKDYTTDPNSWTSAIQPGAMISTNQFTPGFIAQNLAESRLGQIQTLANTPGLEDYANRLVSQEVGTGTNLNADRAAQYAAMLDRTTQRNAGDIDAALHSVNPEGVTNQGFYPAFTGAVARGDVLAGTASHGQNYVAGTPGSTPLNLADDRILADLALGGQPVPLGAIDTGNRGNVGTVLATGPSGEAYGTGPQGFGGQQFASNIRGEATRDAQVFNNPSGVGFLPSDYQTPVAPIETVQTTPTTAPAATAETAPAATAETVENVPLPTANPLDSGERNPPLYDTSIGPQLPEQIPFDAEQPSPNQQIPFDAEQPSPNQQIPFDAEQPSPNQQIPFDAEQPSPDQAIPFDAEQPSPNQTIEEKLEQAIQDAARGVNLEDWQSALRSMQQEETPLWLPDQQMAGRGPYEPFTDVGTPYMNPDQLLAGKPGEFGEPPMVGDFENPSGGPSGTEEQLDQGQKPDLYTYPINPQGFADRPASENVEDRRDEPPYDFGAYLSRWGEMSADPDRVLQATGENQDAQAQALIDENQNSQLARDAGFETPIIGRDGPVLVSMPTRSGNEAAINMWPGGVTLDPFTPDPWSAAVLANQPANPDVYDEPALEQPNMAGAKDVYDYEAPALEQPNMAGAKDAYDYEAPALEQPNMGGSKDVYDYEAPPLDQPNLAGSKDVYDYQPEIPLPTARPEEAPAGPYANADRNTDNLNLGLLGSVEMLQQALQDKGITVQINEGYRSPERQDELYQQGRTTPGDIVTGVQGGQSMHNAGAAVDLQIVDKPDNMTFAQAERAIGQAIKDNPDLGLAWGGNFSNLYDPGHVQLDTTMADAKAQYAQQLADAKTEPQTAPAATASTTDQNTGIPGSGTWEPGMPLVPNAIPGAVAPPVGGAVPGGGTVVDPNREYQPTAPTSGEPPPPPMQPVGTYPTDEGTLPDRQTYAVPGTTYSVVVDINSRAAGYMSPPGSGFLDASTGRFGPTAVNMASQAIINSTDFNTLPPSIQQYVQDAPSRGNLDLNFLAPWLGPTVTPAAAAAMQAGGIQIVGTPVTNEIMLPEARPAAADQPASGYPPMETLPGPTLGPGPGGIYENGGPMVQGPQTGAPTASAPTTDQPTGFGAAATTPGPGPVNPEYAAAYGVNYGSGVPDPVQQYINALRRRQLELGA